MPKSTPSKDGISRISLMATIRVTPSEYREIKRIAEDEGLTIRDWLADRLILSIEEVLSDNQDQ